MRKSRFYLALGAMGAFTWTGVAHATVVLSDDFESYASQAAYEAAWIPIGTVAPISTEWSTEQASSPTHSVKSPVSTVNAQYRNQRVFSETGLVDLTHEIRWSFDFYDSAPTGAPQRNHSNLQDTTAPGSTNQLIAMGFNNNQSASNSGGQYYMARILGYVVPTTADPDGGPTEQGTLGSGAFFKLNDFIAPNRSLGWHNLKVVMSTDDGLSTDYKFYVDGILAEKVDNIGTAASIRSYDNIRIGSGLTNGGTTAFWDNMQLEYVEVPEPATLVMLLAGGLLLSGRRRAA